MRIDPIPNFGREEDGAVAVIVALLLVALLGFAALGVDVASLYRDRAKLQSLSDLSAMSAVAETDDALNRSHIAIERNNAQVDNLETLEFGRYLRNPAIAADARFQIQSEGSAGINAVRLVVKDDAPLHFAQIFTEESHVRLTRTSTATRTDMASFSLNSHLVNIGDGALNDLLAAQFGANATISSGNLQLLADTNVDLGALLVALNMDVGRNPAEILNAVTSGGQFIQALQSILPPSLAGGLEGLRIGAGSGAFAVSSLVGGVDTDLGLTATDALAQTNISALDAIKALIAVESSGEGLDVGLDLDVAGVLSTTTTLTAGEPAAHSGLIAMGEKGIQLHRASLRVETNTSVNPALLGGLATGIEIASVNLPVYAELAGSTATLDEIACDAASPENLAARFLTGPTPLHPQNGTAVAALYLGALPTTAGPVDPADLEFADLLDVNLTIPSLLPLVPAIKIDGVTIQVRSHVAVGTSQTETISFSHADIAQGATVRTFGSGDLLSSATASLLSPENTELRLKPDQDGLVSTLAAPLLATLLAALPDMILANLTAPVDSVLDATLAGIGLELGAGELELTEHYCEVIQLVQ